MMFLDDDLKRLKDCIENTDFYDSICWDKEEMVALLARLEAAERVCETSEYVKASWIHHHFGLTLNNEIERWRKSAGKEEV